MNQRVKLIRKELGMTQEQLAQHLGIGKAALSMIETGKAALSSRNRNILVQELNVNPDWLETGKGCMFNAEPDLTAYMLSTVESWGVYALLYTGLWFGSTFLYMGGAALKPYDVWLAAYRTKKPAPSWPFGMWQYTSTARVPGVSTNVDMSHAYKDYAGIISKKGLTRLREEK